MKKRPYWHIHHEVLWEFTEEPIENRIAYIKTEKAKHEKPEQIILRLLLMKPIKSPPKGLLEAKKALDKAKAEQEKAYANWKDHKDNSRAEKWEVRAAQNAYGKADVAFRRAQEALWRFEDVIRELHKLECPTCTWNGKTIFPSR